KNVCPSAEGSYPQDERPGVADPVAEPPDELVPGVPKEELPPRIAQGVAAEPSTRAQLAVGKILVDGTLMSELGRHGPSRGEARLQERGADVFGRREVRLR